LFPPRFQVWTSCIILIHRGLPSLHHEEIIAKREEVAMILTSLCNQEGKEQRHGAVNARETSWVQVLPPR